MQYKNINFRIAFTGMFLGGALLFQYLSQFMPLVPHLMNINLSLIFIVPIFFISGYWLGMTSILIRFVLGPLMDGGYTTPIVIGHSILLVAGLVFIHLLLIAKKLKLIKNKYGMYIGVVLMTITASFIMATLNGLLFVPLYGMAYGASFKMSSAYMSWGHINTYWAVIYSLYLTGNIINYGMAGFVLVAILKVKKFF